uniref:EGF-like domain-containing protein n=1 Tax=Octopus bimaculoides TaxID=37653 RepID=A0A0L8FVY6_OCTBM
MAGIFIFQFLANPCDSKTCKNGGVCRRRSKTYTCSYKRGYSGKHCTIEKNYIAIDRVNKYT